MSAVATSACSTPRSALGTANSPCFTALPAATTAVHHRGRLAGVRLASFSSISRSHRVYRHDLRGRVRRSQRLCLVAFRGFFHHSMVERPAGLDYGPVAIAVVTYPQNRVVATIVLHHAPTRFGHPHLASG